MSAVLQLRPRFENATTVAITAKLAAFACGFAVDEVGR